MPPERLILLTSDNGVVLSRVTLPPTAPKAEPISSYVVETPRAPHMMTFAKRTEALECFEQEVERSSLP